MIPNNNYTQKWFQQEFSRHAQKPGKTLVVMDEEAFAIYSGTAISAGVIPCIEEEAKSQYDIHQPQRILVSSYTHYGIHAYTQLKWAKDLNVPVIMCLPGRQMRRVAPPRDNSGITIDGMFHLAGQYTNTLRRQYESDIMSSYCEFGVFDGRTFSIAYHALNHTCNRFYAFDSFEGIGDTLAEETSHFVDGDFYANQASFWYNMHDADADLSRITAVPGLFNTSLINKTPADFGISHIFCAHIDVDVYIPALQALQFMTPALVDGALILFDDYDHMAADNSRGERRALREWLAETGYSAELYRSYNALSRAFIIHKS